MPEDTHQPLDPDDGMSAAPSPPGTLAPPLDVEPLAPVTTLSSVVQAHAILGTPSLPPASPPNASVDISSKLDAPLNLSTIPSLSNAKGRKETKKGTGASSKMIPGGGITAR